MVALEGEHGIAIPLHVVRTTGKGTACDEHFVPRQTKLAPDGMCCWVDEEAIGFLTERHHPAGLAFVGGDGIAQTVIDEIGVYELWLQKLRDTLLKRLRGLYFQFAILQCPGKAEESVGSAGEFHTTLLHGRARCPQALEVLSHSIGREQHKGDEQDEGQVTILHILVVFRLLRFHRSMCA